MNSTLSKLDDQAFNDFVGSNTNQSHKSEDASESNEVKIGAFATKKVSCSDTMRPSEAEDDFLDLFTLEGDKSEASAAAAAPAVEVVKETKVILPENSPAKKVLLFNEDSETASEKKKGDFVMLETPFSVAGNTLDNPRGDLGVFFKEVQSAPQIMTECNEMTDACLEVQLNSLGDQLMAYENKSAEYDDLLKMLESTAMTSESESEAS